MTALFQEFKMAIERFSPQQQIAFACGCCEHVLPFFEHLRFNPALRELLEAEWQVVFGGKVRSELYAELEAKATPSIPNISEDEDIRAEIAMKSAVCVFEVMDIVLKQDAAASVRVGCTPIEVVQLLQLHIGKPAHPEFDLFEIIDNPLIVPQEIHHEWVLINEMIKHIGSTDSISHQWRERQSARGEELLALYRESL